MQLHCIHTRRLRRRPQVFSRRIHVNVCLVIWVQPEELYENHAALTGLRRMPGTDRIAHVATNREIPVLVRERSLQHQILLTAVVGVGGKATIGRITNQACHASDFFSVSLEHTTRHAG